MADYYEGPTDRARTAEDYRKFADNVADWSPLSRKPLEWRLKAAENFGPNWASIMSGCGDQ
jgi:hypothetical protein